jgi:acyl carrier protein
MARLGVDLSGLEEIMVDWVRKNSDLDSDERAEVRADTNLIENAIVDSIGFLELIAFAEERTGLQIDLMSVDPNDLQSIRGLCRHLSKNACDPQ